MQQTPTPVVKLKADAWQAWMGRLQLVRVEDQAAHIGVSRAQLYQILAGAVPGERFIAACMATYDGKFEQLFKIAESS
ncbi:MAG TPA: hypothetical protein VGM12_30925 [Trebonia sp.]